ncbi:MAG: glycoside hydrolase family 57 protein [bacterium]
MTKKPLYLAFLWHMHQPYYKDNFSGRCILPWVRLHGIKDYYDMAAILEEYPQIHQTFNLTPSLMEQIEGYLEGKTEDDHLCLSRKPASKLNKDDKRFILDSFFMAHWDNMVRVHPRYRELLERRGEDAGGREKALKEFSVQDFRDLQVWFNLAWFDPFFKTRDETIKALIEKDRNFTEADKRAVLEKQMEVMARILPIYQKLQEAGQIEVSVTPYYHSILPLLCDTDITLRAMPEAPLPRNRFVHPEDAEIQVEAAISYYKKHFNRPPRGMWPAEGSVSEAIIPMMAKRGINWIATDEAILANTLKNSPDFSEFSFHVKFQPYRIRIGEYQIDCIFRDTTLSNLLSFEYWQWDTEEAVADLMGRLHVIRKIVNNFPGDHLVAIIMDGENAWEYYENDGWDFLGLLYQKLSADLWIKTVTASEYLKDHPPAETLPRLFPGSWINNNFKIWIGHEEDNTAWNYLYAARQALVKFEQEAKGQADQKAREQAWQEIYIAEGSDWCWWYGEEHGSYNDREFDLLFRTHLMNVYRLIGQEIPTYLSQPIIKVTHHGREFSTMR